MKPTSEKSSENWWSGEISNSVTGYLKILLDSQNQERNEERLIMIFMIQGKFKTGRKS